MVSLWHKYQIASKRKKQTLHSLIVGFVFFAFLYAITKFFSIPLCPIQSLFGISCPGCGLTRGFISILHLDFYKAIQYHILSIPLFIGIVLYTSFAIVDILFNKDYIQKIETQCQKPYMILLFFLLLVLSAVLNRVI